MFVSFKPVGDTSVNSTDKYRVIAVLFCLQVKYECLSDEIKIGDYYLRLLLEEDENEESNAIKRS